MPAMFSPHRACPSLMIFRLPKQSCRPTHRHPATFHGAHCPGLGNPGSPSAEHPQDPFVGFSTSIPPVMCYSWQRYQAIVNP